MKIAIVSPGPIRSFADCYSSWIDNMIKPLEEQVGKGNVKIFLDYFSVDNEFYQQQFNKNIFTTKMEIDRPGWKEIISNSEYIELANQYTYTDDYILDIFTKINTHNNSELDAYELKKYNINKQRRELKYKSYYNFIQGLCSNFNNKKLIDKVSHEYDVIIKLRCDAELLNKYPVKEVLNINDNTIYLQRGTRWDNFYMAKRDTLVKLYSDLYKHMYQNILKFKQNIVTPEMFLTFLIKSHSIDRKYYNYSHIKKKQPSVGSWKVSRHLPGGEHTKYKRT